jgi:predicted transcriptional regulator
MILKNLIDEKGLTQEDFYNASGINTASHFIIAQNELSRAVLTTSKLKI